MGLLCPSLLWLPACDLLPGTVLPRRYTVDPLPDPFPSTPRRYPLEKRRPSVFWRGSTTNPTFVANMGLPITLANMMQVGEGQAVGAGCVRGEFGCFAHANPECTSYF